MRNLYKIFVLVLVFALSVASVQAATNITWTKNGGVEYPNYINDSIGIGLTNPTANLEVQATSTNSVPLYVWNNTGGPILSALNNGNVGIGTSTPTQPLVVLGNAAGNYAGYQVANTASNGVSMLQLLNSNAVTGAAAGDMSFFCGGPTQVIRNFEGLGTGARCDLLGHGFNSFFFGEFDASPVGLVTSNVIRQYVDATGKVGFGVGATVASSTPYGVLSINPVAAQNAAPSFVVGSSTGTNFIITNAGRTGVGTVAPDALFNAGILRSTLDTQCGNTGRVFIGPIGTVGGDQCPALMVTQVDGNGNSIMRLGSAGQPWAGEFVASVAGVSFGTKTAVPFAINNNGNRVMTIDTTLNTGFGSTTPWGKLSASSTSAFPTLAIKQIGTGPSAIFEGGNVGIGTTSPIAQFSVRAASSTLATTKGAGLITAIAGFENTVEKLFEAIDQWGGVYTQGDVPSVSACGTSPVVEATSNQRSGRITIGTGLITSCVVTFAHPYAAGSVPHVFLNQSSGSFLSTSATSVSTTGFTISSGGTNAGDVFDYEVIASW